MLSGCVNEPCMFQNRRFLPVETVYALNWTDYEPRGGDGTRICRGWRWAPDRPYRLIRGSWADVGRCVACPRKMLVNRRTFQNRLPSGDPHESRRSRKRDPAHGTCVSQRRGGFRTRARLYQPISESIYTTIGHSISFILVSTSPSRPSYRGFTPIMNRSSRREQRGTAVSTDLWARFRV